MFLIIPPTILWNNMCPYENLIYSEKYHSSG